MSSERRRTPVKSPGLHMTKAGSETADAAGIPQHVAVIMDGNGRWAKGRSLPRSAGHRAGVRRARAIVETCGRRGVTTLTLFAFSSENWRRPESEVGMLMKLFVEALQREVKTLDENGVRLRFIGDRESLGAALQAQVAAAEERTAHNEGLDLVIAVAYGGRWDLVQAARQLAVEVADGSLAPGSIDERAISERLALSGLPDVDLLIRTGGERRISNFLLWQLAYSELFFSTRLWPDFADQDLDEALAFYAARQRRFGLTPEQAREASV